MNNGQSNPGNKDYLDKGLESVERKFGGAQGQKLAGNRNMNEKIVRLPLPRFYPPSCTYIFTTSFLI
jgi:hypothetical protein